MVQRVVSVVVCTAGELVLCPPSYSYSYEGMYLLVACWLSTDAHDNARAPLQDE